MMGDPKSHGSEIVNLLLGIGLVLFGLIFLILQLINQQLTLGNTFWPFLIIIPGVLIFALAFVGPTREAEPLASLGSIVTMVGVLLAYQNSTGHWESWAYAWALIMPTAWGLGQWLYGTLRNNSTSAARGTRLMLIGAVLFLVGFFFFEVVIGISGFNLGGVAVRRFGLPIVLIGLGLSLVLYNLWTHRAMVPPHQDS